MAADGAAGAAGVVMAGLLGCAGAETTCSVFSRLMVFAL